MKSSRIVLLAVVGVIVVASVIVAGVLFFSEKEQEGILLINEHEMQGANVTFFWKGTDQYVTLPLLVVLQEAGCLIEWETPELVYITANEITYTLDYQSKTLTTEEKSHHHDLLTPAPGTKNYVCSFTDTDVIIDLVTLHSICSWMEIPITVDHDFKQQTVNITFS